MTEPIVVIDSLTVEHGSVPTLSNVSLKIGAGEIFVLIGPSPSGKTVLLRCIAGLEKPVAGSIMLNGMSLSNVPPSKRNIPLTFQDFALFPHLTVFENIAFGLRMRALDKKSITSEVEQMMKLVGLDGLGERFPRQLSGGQQQRVALARSMILKPPVLLLDEPLANLDFKLQKKMMEELKQIHRQLGLTIIYVTHSLEQALGLADTIAILNKGRIEQVGAPNDIYEHPNSLFAARSVGALNMLIAELVSSSEDDVVEARTSIGTFKGRAHIPVPVRKVAYCIRPESIDISDEAQRHDNKVKVTLSEQIYRGSDAEYLTQLPNGMTFTIHKKGKEIVDYEDRVGREIAIGWDEEKAFVLHRSTSYLTIDEDTGLSLS